MFLIVGLGNPGLDYAYTRHNVGFMSVDYLAYEFGFPEFQQRFNSLYTEKFFDGNAKVVLQKPQTYMNNSGNAVSQLVSFYKIAPQNVFVIHDDLDMRPMQLRIKFGGSSGGHNGLRDIEKGIGKDYWHIKVGIGRPIERSQVANYVLSSFYKEELTILKSKVFEILGRHIEELLFAEDRTLAINKIMQEATCL